MIPYGRQDIDEADIEAVVRVLRSDWLTQGPAVGEFEAALGALCGAAHVLALNSATSALHVACAAMGLGPGGLLWTTPNTFVASANCARYCGADVDFVDIDARTWNMSVDALAAKLERAQAAGRLPDIVVPVHFSGASCDMAAIGELSRRYGFRVLEDASHAVGGSYRGRPVGACEHSDATVFSFHPVKIVTTGEGGAIATNDPALARRAAILRTHGITRDEALMQGAAEGAWYYEQIDLGWNYRITCIQAALGTSQLRRIGSFIGRREQLAARYDEALRDLPLTTPTVPSDVRSAWHLYVVRVRPDAGVDRATVFARMRERGVGVNVHYIPVHLQPYYAALGFRRGDFPEAESYYDEAITLPLYAAMTDDDQRRVIEALAQSLRR